MNSGFDDYTIRNLSDKLPLPPNFANPILPTYGIDPDSYSPGIGNPFFGGGGSRNIQLSAHFSF